MKKKLSVLLALILVLAMTATGCGSEKNDTEATPTTAPTEATQPTEAPTEAPTTAPTEAPTEIPSAPAEPLVNVNIGDYLADESHWEDDGGDYSIKDGKLVFNNAYYGDFCAVRLKDSFTNMNAQFTAQFTDIAADVSMDEGTWWDTEFLCLLRSNFAGSSFVEGIDGQAGYCITSWGDMSQFSLGRSGYDDVFGTYDWPMADGQPHKIEFTAENNADNTLITLTVKVDGNVLATAEDDGSLVKKDRISFFPEAGGITIRCKYLGATITDFNSEIVSTPVGGQDDEAKTIAFADYYGDPAKWEVNGEASVHSDKITFETTEAGASAAVRLTETAKNATTKFSLQFTSFGKVSMDDWTWWDSEFLCLLRSSLADKGFTDGQTGYSITSWGDMSTFFLGRSGHDDAFGEFDWPMEDGNAHDFEITLQNNEDDTAVTITVVIDGTEVASVTDDGTITKEGRTPLFPDAGGVTLRCLYLGAEVK